MRTRELEVTRVVVALYQEKGSRFRFPGERHAGLFEIFHLDRGRAWVRAGRHRFRAVPGECYLYGSGEFHRHQATQGQAPHYITVAFTARGGGVLRALTGRRWMLPAALRSLLARVLAEQPKALAGSTMRRALLNQFLVEWLRLAQAQDAAPERSRKSFARETYHEKTAHEAVAKALAYLNENFSRRVNLEQAAVAAGVSPPHLRQLARLILGHSLRDELRSLRIRHAKHLLSHTTHNAKEVSAAAGYRNLAAFSRAFRRVEGLPPSAYARTVAARGPTPLPQKGSFMPLTIDD